MSLWKKPVRDAAPAVSTWDLLALSLQVRPPKSTGNADLDSYNDGIYMAQCHLHGRALGSNDDRTRENYLRIRADLNHLRTDTQDIE